MVENVRKYLTHLKKKEFSKALFGSMSSLFATVATVVRLDLSTHGKVIRNACAVPETVFVFVMKVFWPPGIC